MAAPSEDADTWPASVPLVPCTTPWAVHTRNPWSLPLPRDVRRLAALPSRGAPPAVSSRLMWRAGVLLTCGPPLADGVVIGHGLSFKVADFRERVCRLSAWFNLVSARRCRRGDL